MHGSARIALGGKHLAALGVLIAIGLGVLLLLGSPGTPCPAQDDEPAHTNRLAGETSPYLRLHAHNPVDWYPWGEEALERAREENKPIFLSIGYSSCYWCHVMEREAFSDPEVAAFLNEHFICIKVDREERPDVDEIYMNALQVYYHMIGSPQSGGWPLSMFLTPEGKPFFGGTYWPLVERDGMPGFLEVIERVHEAWTEQQEDLEEAADRIASVVELSSRIARPLSTAEPGRELVDAAIAAQARSYDFRHGGFGFDFGAPNAPKFPQPPRILLLLGEYERLGGMQEREVTAGHGLSADELAEMLTHTLDAIAAGGIRDHVGGGFHRYSTDAAWRVPHFEKMLYDNAQLLSVYAEAYRLFGNEEYGRVVEETYAYLMREMRDPAGGFYTALDAETEREEGAFYVWTPPEVVEVLGAAEADVFNRVYGLAGGPNFEGHNVLLLARPIDEHAEALGLEPDELQRRLAGMRARLLEARERRERPLLDNKIITGMNGLTIRGLAHAGRVFDERRYLEAATQAAEFVLENLQSGEGRLLHSYCLGEAELNAYLDDYADFIAGLIALHEATREERWLDEARRLMDQQIELFWDAGDVAGHQRDAGATGGFFYTPHDHDVLFARTKPYYDGVQPSGNSASAQNLVRLAALTGDERYAEYAERQLDVFAPLLEESPDALAVLAEAMAEWVE